MELPIIRKKDLENFIRQKISVAFNRSKLTENDLKELRISVNSTLIRIHIVPDNARILAIIYDLIGHNDNLIYEEIREESNKNVLFGLVHMNQNEIAVVLVHTYNFIE